MSRRASGNHSLRQPAVCRHVRTGSAGLPVPPSSHFRRKSWGTGYAFVDTTEQFDDEDVAGELQEDGENNLGVSGVANDWPIVGGESRSGARFRDRCGGFLAMCAVLFTAQSVLPKILLP
mmetsp:Transcript_5665/g.9966  ORF Transcript_5665/g.9966 Transcript_5665/m.9966 type:complete len:120 (-) Transcript_5665:1043-1402(-)